MRILSESRILLTPALMAARTFRPKPDQPRNRGVHVQSVNRVLAIAAGKLEDNPDDATFEKFSDTCYPLLPALGVSWEEFRASLYSESELVWQPGEWERDGIFGTPDGLLIGMDEPTIWECKLNYKKLKPLAEEWLYLKQGLSYCAMSGISRVQYDVCWALGDYSRPYKPVGTVTLVEFEQREVETWWERIKATAWMVQPE